MLRKVLIIAVLLCLFISLPVYASIQVVVDGQALQFDVPPVVENGRVLVPLRFVSEALGATVDWNEATQTATITSENGTSVAATVALEPSTIFNLVSPAVFGLEIFDEYGNLLGKGSGFILSQDGKAVTNYHVIKEAYAAKAKLFDGRSVGITKVLYTDKDRDMAIMKLNGSSFPFVKLGNSDEIITGQRVLTIGNPLGLENTISDGIISSKKRMVGNYPYIQLTAPISKGSSGGVLLNYKAEAIGVTTLYYLDGQNLNFAIPINDVVAKLNSTGSSIQLHEYQKIVKNILFENELLRFYYPSNWLKIENKIISTLIRVVFVNADRTGSEIRLSLDQAKSQNLDEYYRDLLTEIKNALPFDTVKISSNNTPLTINGKTFYKIMIESQVDDMEIWQNIVITMKGTTAILISYISPAADFAKDTETLDNIINTLQFK